jgi:thioredoxin-like negative regulator of GroEL
MIDITTKEEFEKFIKENGAALLYFSTPQCNVCKVLKPKLEEFIKDEFEKMICGYVNMELIPSISAQNQIFTVPTILVYLNGKEFLRKSRNINLEEFREELQRPYSLYFG